MPAFAVDEMNDFFDEARTLADQERAMMAVGGPAAASLAGAGAAAPAGLQPGAGQPQSIFVLMEEITTGSCRSQHRRIIGCLHLS
jgi:hypothetical protein